MFECLICGKPCNTGTFCKEACEKAREIDGELVALMMADAMMESRMWEAVREAERTGRWN